MASWQECVDCDLPDSIMVKVSHCKTLVPVSQYKKSDQLGYLKENKTEKYIKITQNRCSISIENTLLIVKFKDFLK